MQVMRAPQGLILYGGVGVSSTKKVYTSGARGKNQLHASRMVSYVSSLSSSWCDLWMRR